MKLSFFSHKTFKNHVKASQESATCANKITMTPTSVIACLLRKICEQNTFRVTMVKMNEY